MTYSSYRSAGEIPDRDPNPPEAYAREPRELPVTVRLSVTLSIAVPMYRLEDESDADWERFVRKEYDRNSNVKGLLKDGKVESLDDFELIETIDGNEEVTS